MTAVMIDLQPLARRAPDVDRRSDRRLDHEVYVRRRVALVLVAAVAAMFVGLAAHTGSEPSGGSPASAAGRAPSILQPAAVPPAPAPAGVRDYLVQPGDSLWSIAEDLVPSGGDVDAMVRRLEELNGSADLEVGASLVLPG